MTKRLDKPALAYNACVEALAEAEEALEQAAVTRAAAYSAAEALYPGNSHGGNSSKAALGIKADGTVVWR